MGGNKNTQWGQLVSMRRRVGHDAARMLQYPLPIERAPATTVIYYSVTVIISRSTIIYRTLVRFFSFNAVLSNLVEMNSLMGEKSTSSLPICIEQSITEKGLRYQLTIVEGTVASIVSIAVLVDSVVEWEVEAEEEEQSMDMHELPLFFPILEAGCGISARISDDVM